MIDVEKLSMEQLLDLNRRVVDRIRYLNRLKVRSQLDRFEIGDRVGFQSEGRMVEGLIVRVNSKTASIKTQDGYWRIHPRFLSRLPNSTTKLPDDVRAILENDDPI